MSVMYVDYKSTCKGSRATSVLDVGRIPVDTGLQSCNQSAIYAVSGTWTERPHTFYSGCGALDSRRIALLSRAVFYNVAGMAADDDNSWQVVCNELSGVLHGSKFISGTRGDCIHLADANDGEKMVTPKAFLDEAGVASDRSNWKRIIEIKDNSQRTRKLQHIIDSGLLSILRPWPEEYLEGSSRKVLQ